MNQIILTGATGFIGAYFIDFLVKKGVNVIALGRKRLDDVPTSRIESIKRANYIQLDMKDILQLPNKLAEHQIHISNDCAFYNLAWGGVAKLSDLDISAQLSNVGYSVNALEVASLLGCKKFIQVGTMEEAFTLKYLGLDYRQSSYYNRHVIYSVAKLAAKKAIEAMCKQKNIDYNYVLHSHVMGPHDDKDSFLQVTLQKLISNEELVFSTGEQLFDVISPYDCALGYYLIASKGISGKTYWVGSGNPRPLRKYVEEMYELYPSGQAMQFGKLPYNDIVLEPDDFSIENLTQDTGYMPTKEYSEIVRELYDHLLESSYN